MKTTHIEYPYPILSPTTNDYKNGSFITDVKSEYSTKDVTLIFKFMMSSSFLSNLIKEGNAKYSVLIECNSTRYRTIFSTCNDCYTISINEADIGDSLSISISVVANNDIPNFQSDEFKSFFESLSFNIFAGDVLAKDKSRVININKSYAKCSSSSSIFNIEKSEDDEPLNWISSKDYILIKLPQKVYDYYELLSLNPQTHSVITNVIIVPVLTQILTEIRDDKEIYRETNWIKVIFSQLKELGLTEDKLEDINSISNLAYKIFPQSIDKSFTFISGLLSNIEEEDE